MYVKDFLRELDKLNIEIGQEELDEINRISDSTGKVFPPPHKIEYFIQNGKDFPPLHKFLKTNHLSIASRSRKQSLRSTATTPRFTVICFSK